MAGDNRSAVLRGIERIFNEGSLTGLTETQLLRRFVGGDEAAFEALIARHGPMVLGVGRRLLRDPRDVEDAFQATFLVLLRKAGGIRDAEALGSWLYGVAYRVATRIRSRVARCPEGERKGARPEAVATVCELERGELRAAIDEEIHRLPEKYRRPLVLCDLEGRTYEEAARRLRCTTGSVSGRLNRARRTLRERLARRGLAPVAGLGALAMVGETASAAVPAPMVAGTVATLARAATATAVSGAASPAAVELANRVFRSMVVAKLKLAVGLVVGIVAMGTIPLVVALEPNGLRVSPQPAPTPRTDDRKADERPQGITVTGRVLDDAGRPIAGARVVRGSDIRSRKDVPEATTDADGRFVMPGVPAGPIVLTVQAAGHAPELMSVTAGPGLAPVAFRLGPGHTIRGRIVDAHEKPIAGAPIAAEQWRGHHSLRWNTQTDADGRFRWDDAPADGVLIDLGQLGFKGKRFWTATPDAPEKTIVMRRALHVRGRVTDAQTGRPVKAFTLVPGYCWQNDSGMSWENEDAKDISGLSYDVLLSTAFQLRVIRIEAEGYLPGVSRPLKDDEEDVVVHFALERGSGVMGVVHLPGGSPLAGAEVMLATSSQPTYLNNGRTHPSANHQRIVKTRADGRFSLPTQDPPFTILALHDRGYAIHEVTARPVAPAELTVQPWSRVEGTLRLGRQPGADLKLSLDRGGRYGEQKVLWWGGFATTDGQGQFTFDRVAPGTMTISRLIPFGSISQGGGSPSAELDVAPGTTVRLTLGGTGQPIVGQAAIPASLADRKDWVFGGCYLNRKPIGQVEPDQPPGRRAVTVYTFKVELDGSFRIEDIAAGTYDMHILVEKRPAEGYGPTGEILASVRRDVIVPPIPGGRSDEPLDLGIILLEDVRKPVAKPGQRSP